MRPPKRKCGFRLSRTGAHGMREPISAASSAPREHARIRVVGSEILRAEHEIQEDGQSQPDTEHGQGPSVDPEDIAQPASDTLQPCHQTPQLNRTGIVGDRIR